MRIIPILVVLALGLRCYAQGPPQVNKGVLDITKHDLSQFNTIDLDGEWEFYWNALLDPYEITLSEKAPSYIKIPAIWNKYDHLNGDGYATYRLIIKKRKDQELLGFLIPNVYTNYKMWADGQPLAENGLVGTNEKEADPDWHTFVRSIHSTKEELEIVLQVSNFHHYRGGVHKSFYLGTPDKVVAKRETAIMANMLLVGGLLMLGSFFIIFYFLRRQNVSSLYYGIFCVFWAIRSIFAHMSLADYFLGRISWAPAIRIEYLTLYVSFLFGMLFIHTVFKNNNSLFKTILNLINFVFIVLTVILSPYYFTRLLPAFHLFVGINLIYALFIIILAITRKQKEAWFTGVSIIVGIGLFIYELVVYNFVNEINLIYLNLGYLSVAFLNSLVLAHGFVQAHKRVDALEKEKSTRLEIMVKI